MDTARLLRYYEDLLERISHADHPTFRKELRKAFRRLDQSGRDQLKAWFRESCVCRVGPARAVPVPVVRPRGRY
jgi:hypothetical protein